MSFNSPSAKYKLMIPCNVGTWIEQEMTKEKGKGETSERLFFGWKMVE